MVWAMATGQARKVSWVGLLGGVLVSLAAAALPFASWWQGVEQRGEGLLLKWRGPLPFNDQVMLVALDDPTFARMKPIPRGVTARVLEALERAGARAVGFDYIFRGMPVDGEQGLKRFAAATTRFGRAVGMFDCFQAAVPIAPRDLESLRAVSIRGRTVPRTECPSVLLSEDVGSLIPSHVSTYPGSSGFVRSYSLFVGNGDVDVMSLAPTLFAVGRGVPFSEIRFEGGRLLLGDRFLEPDAQGQVLMTYRDYSQVPAASLIDLVDAIGASEPPTLPERLAAQFRDKFVLFGYATHSDDVGPVITGERTSLCLMHLSLVSDLIEKRQAREIPPGLQALFALLAGLLMTLAAVLLSPRNASLALVALVIDWVAIVEVLLGRDVMVGPFGPPLAALLSALVVLVARLGTSERERRLLSDAFGSYVHPTVLRRILEDPAGTLALGGARRTVSVLFSDIEGYTRISNQAPEEVLGLMREYLEAMIRLATANEGRVDKIIGDGLLVVFGDPIPNADHALRAVRTGLQMQREVERLQQKWAAEGRHGLTIRVGVATGEVFVGNIGASGSKIEYTVLGPTVNLASRLEGKAPSGRVLVSKETREACGDAQRFERVEGLQLKGFAEAVEAFLVEP